MSSVVDWTMENPEQTRRLFENVCRGFVLTWLMCMVLGVGAFGYALGYENGELAERVKKIEVLAR
jgi:hypothetical protein